MLAALVPLALIRLSVDPEVLPIAMSAAPLKLPDVDVTVLIKLIAATLALVSEPLTFIDSACSIEKDAHSITKARGGPHLPKVDCVIVELNAIVWPFSEGGPRIPQEFALRQILLDGN